ncbi:phytoene desaturase family protein [Thermodesulfobacteriota bacterium]
MWNTKTNRREFLTISAMAAASFAFGCTPSKEGRHVDRLAHKNLGDYPVVVIGAGLGGLASAVYLAKAGFPVTLIEQHNIPGGYATAFRRGNYDFDVSLHAFNLNPRIYQELGLHERLDRVTLKQCRRLITPDKDLLLPDADPEAYLDLMYSHFPREKEGIRGYVNECFAIFDEVVKISRKGNDLGFLSKMLFFLLYPNMFGVRNKTLSDLLDDHVKDIEVRGMLCHLCDAFGLPPSRLSGFYYAMITGGFLKHQPSYIKARSQDLSNTLSDIIKENNGKMIFGTPVEEILIKEDRVSGVRTSDGKVFPARFVVSNANAPDTFGRFLSSNSTASGYLKELSKYRPSISSFIVWLGLKGEIRGKIPGCTIYISPEPDVEKNFKYCNDCDADKSPLNVALYDNYYKGYSKPGTSTLTLMMLSGYEPWRRFEKEYFSGNKARYYQQKNRIAQKLIQRLEKSLIPDLSKMIDVMEASTPLTNLRYTRNPEGAIYGYPNSIDNSFMNRIPNTTPVKGLYLAGGWGKFSGSYPGAIMGGRNAFKLILKDL